MGDLFLIDKVLVGNDIISYTIKESDVGLWGKSSEYSISKTQNILNSDRFYQLSKCELNKYGDAYNCIDENESYYGEGVIIGKFFLPKPYEFYKTNQCKLISDERYLCIDNSRSYEGKGVVEQDLLFPIYGATE